MIQPQAGDVPTVSLVALYAAWETLKMMGVPSTLKNKLFGEKSALTGDDRKSLEAHYEQCRSCVQHQQRQIQLLEKISDSAIKIQTMIERVRK